MSMEAHTCRYAYPTLYYVDLRKVMLMRRSRPSKEQIHFLGIF